MKTLSEWMRDLEYELPRSYADPLRTVIGILEALPRCLRLDDDGVLIKDFPVVIGHTNLYAVLTVGDPPSVKMCRFGTIAMREDHDRENSWIVECRDEDGEEFELPLHRCCNSEEAAQAQYEQSV